LAPFAGLSDDDRKAIARLSTGAAYLDRVMSVKEGWEKKRTHIVLGYDVDCKRDG
jgi:hypothetical protein